VGTGIFEAHQAAQLHHQVQTLQQQQAPLIAQLQQLQNEHAAATNRLASLLTENEQLKSNPNQMELLKLRGEVTRLQNETNDPTEEAARALAAKVNKLKQRLEQTPDARIPELQFLTDQDWINAANGRLDNDADYRRALSTLRKAGEGKVAAMLKKALAGYMQGSNGQLPTDLAQLQPYFDSPLDDAILQRWEIAPANVIHSLKMGGDAVITQKAPVDEVFDTRFGIGPNGFGQTGFLPDETYVTLNPVFEAYRAAHNGQWQTDMSQLVPYVKTPEQQAALQKLILRDSANN
jgi:hypothetical protein